MIGKLGLQMFEVHVYQGQRLQRGQPGKDGRSNLLQLPRENRLRANRGLTEANQTLVVDLSPRGLGLLMLLDPHSPAVLPVPSSVLRPSYHPVTGTVTQHFQAPRFLTPLSSRWRLQASPTGKLELSKMFKDRVAVVFS